MASSQASKLGQPYYPLDVKFSDESVTYGDATQQCNQL